MKSSKYQKSSYIYIPNHSQQTAPAPDPRVNEMSTKYNASISLTKIKELIESKHPSIQTAQNGKTYLNLDVWVDDEEKTWDDGNKSIGSIQARPTKDERELKTKHNLGQLKLPQYKVDANALGSSFPAHTPKPETKPETTQASSNYAPDDLPF